MRARRITAPNGISSAASDGALLPDEAADLTGKPIASTAIAPTARAAYSRVVCHCTAPISHCMPGTTAKVPNDPAAVTMPKAVPRLFSGTTCATAPRMTTYEVALSARPTITPSPRYSVAVEAASDSSANPTAYRAAPTTITHRGPIRSAIMPASGSPNMMFCTAIDRLNVSRPVCRVAVIGWRNSPNDCRAPIAMATVRAPSRITSAGRFMTLPSIPDRPNFVPLEGGMTRFASAPPCGRLVETASDGIIVV